MSKCDHRPILAELQLTVQDTGICTLMGHQETINGWQPRTHNDLVNFQEQVLRHLDTPLDELEQKILTVAQGTDFTTSRLRQFEKLLSPSGGADVTNSNQCDLG